MNIILDLDGCLISEIGKSHKKIVARPYLKEFLFFCFSQFKNVSIWTAADRSWYNRVYDKFLQPILDDFKANFDFVYCSEKCRVLHDPNPDDPFPTPVDIKPLRKVWKRWPKKYTRHNTIIVDDTPHTFCWNYGNAIHIKTYDDISDSDTELLKVIDILKKCILHHGSNGTVRTFKK